ncbi:MAG: hypothetical protein DHS20C20_25040 [Ardenticatenaceae bacterium]|nr:MAG: hypothetical protein DHS20C20_25040 [Ardenticatenaceae bacterium]
MSRLKRTPILLATILVMLGAGWLYWPTVQLPLIYDTLLHIRIVGGLDFGSVWLPTEAFGFYRPMTFFPMLLIEALFGEYPAWLLHGNNVLQHGLNTGLLAWLSWRLWPDWRRAFATGAIFATFPFAYQAVTVYGHNVHPAMTGLVLLGLHSYLSAIRGTQSFTEETQRTTEKREEKSFQSAKSVDKTANRWQFITWILFGLMVLTHETAVLFGGFAALLHICIQPELLTQPRKLLRQPWRWFLLAGVVYLLIYQFLPISRAPQAVEVGKDLWLNGLYLLQAAVFPIAWFAHLLPNVSGELITLAGAGLVLAAAGWLAWRKPAWRAPLLLANGWWAASSLLLAITLPTDYLLRGPRLLYLGSVGVALLWAHLLAGVWPTLTPALSRGERALVPSPFGGGLGRGLIWTAVLVFILLTSTQFVRTKLTQYEQLTEPVRVAQATDLIYLPSTEVFFVNLPQWLDVPPNTYAIGVEFVSMLGDYLFVEELINANVIDKDSVWAVELPELQSQTEYAYGIHAQHSWPQLTDNMRLLFFITTFANEQPQTQSTGFLIQIPTSDEEFYVNAGFDTYQLQIGDPNIFVDRKVARACDGVVNVRLVWRQRYTDIPDTTSVFVQVLDENGRLIGQSDGPPLGIRPGLLGATPDWTLFDLREIPLEEGETAHTLLVGVYDFATGERSPATDSNGQPLPDNAWRWPITNCSQTE